VILETCAESFHVADAARAMGHDVRVVPATLVRTLGVGHRGIKTDKRDAEALSEVSTRIELPSVHIPSSLSRNWRAILNMRQVLVEARTQLVNSVRGWLRMQLISVGRGVPETIPARVEQKLLELPTGMPAFVQRQLKVIESLNEQIKEANGEVRRLAEQDALCCRLMAIPGVGPMTASYFIATVDDVTRFPGAHRLQSYLGLTPGERSSSLKTRRTGITKAGPSDVRRVLCQAAWVIMFKRPQDPLAKWGNQIAQRRGKQIAAIAISRKLAGIMFAMWRDGTEYQPDKVSRLAAGTWEIVT
jgi:transposase